MAPAEGAGQATGGKVPSPSTDWGEAFLTSTRTTVRRFSVLVSVLRSSLASLASLAAPGIRAAVAIGFVATTATACYPNPNDLDGSGAMSGGSTGTGSGGKTGGGGGKSAAGGSTSTVGTGGAVASSGGLTGTAGRAATGGSTGGGGKAGATGGSSGGGSGGTTTTCTNPMFPVLCPASGSIPSSCWATGTQCTTVKACDGGALAACASAALHPVCGTSWCVGDTVTTLAQASCGRLQACAPHSFAYNYTSMATCVAALEVSWGIYSSSLPDTGWTNATRTACASALSAQTCANYLDAPVAACQVLGTRSSGSACVIDDQCVSLRCVYASGASCGQCAPRGAVGVACSNDGDCGTSLVCASSGTCVTAVGLGGACNATTAPCRYSLSCRSGVCSTPGQAGTVCADNEDCDIANGFLCNGTTLKCGATTSGTTCGSNADGSVRTCASRGFCNSDGTCRASAKEGEACNDSTGPLCVRPAFCSAGTCLVTKAPIPDCPIANMSLLP